ncbi:tRNA uridine-5-carboxymethylaminomethyl(34) synthesis GTPase MnmE [Alteromonadaceae bacterium M269]|nr:tRNA uridine-5-carboxymethylaminomethyl(34) synthesis GTPase MnmE [Alteromonadaceae bacterium M269]
MNQDTIIAQATAPGKAGVGIIRVSGSLASEVASKLLKKVPAIRQAEYLPFYDNNDNILDQGIALFFKAPNSFTGEDVLELQGHGGQVLMDMVLKSCLETSKVRLARPGEFSERAFLNDKLDLAQAEAIADLINADSEQAARSALRSMQGVFSTQVNHLVELIIHLRMYVEAAIDFPDEEIDFLSDGKVSQDLQEIIQALDDIRQQAQQGRLLREGMNVVIAGRPNAGKSSLLNSLAGHEAAIVTDIEGTTRDVLKEHIHIDGMPLHIIDTAGLRESADKVEQIGIQRAWKEIEQADRVLLLVDASSTSDEETEQLVKDFEQRLPTQIGLTLVRNKIDLTQDEAGLQTDKVVNISANQGLGMGALKEHLKACMGFESNNEGQFIARRRHIDALEKANEHVLIGQQQLMDNLAGELLAEELRLAQQHLNEITGEFSSDDLLSRIFSSFCIGK